MLPLTTKDIIAFTPEREGAPTYSIGVPTMAGRATFRRKVEEAGAQFISDAALLEILRDGVREHVSEAQQGEALGIIDAFETSEDEAALVELSALVKDIERQIRAVYPPYIEATAARGYYLSITPLIATRCFLRGIEGGVKFESKAGTITDECLEKIPEADVKAIGWKACSLMTPTGTQIKNSESPLQSTANPETLTAEK